MPVSIAHLVQHRHEVLGGDVAGRPGRDRAAAELAEARLERLDARLQRREHVGEALAAGVVEVGGELDVVAERVAGGGEEVADLRRVGHPGGVAEADLLGAGGLQPAGDLEHPLGRDVALVGAAEGDRDHALAAQALAAGAGEHGLEPGQRLLDRAVDVLAVVGLGGAEEDVDLVEALALAERVLEPLLVRDQHGDRDVARRVDAVEHLLGVGELRDHVGAHEARDLEALEAGAGEQRRSAAPSRRWGSSPARSGSRREGRPRGCGHAWAPWAVNLYAAAVSSPVVLLAGGTGGAKLARGMLDEVGSDLVVIANTGDDVEIHGGYVSPDPDLVLYWLADRIDERGWGIRGDTFAVMDALRELGEDVWFNLGDHDLAVCLQRARRLGRARG